MKLYFLKGKSDDLYLKNEDGATSNSLKNFNEGSFLLTTDTYDFYYKNQDELIKLFSNPNETIKEIKTYYYKEINPITPPEIPTQLPIDFDKWGDEIPEYNSQDKIYFIKCIIYKNGSIACSELQSLINDTDIDYIINNVFGTSVLGQSVLGEMILNQL